MRIPAALLFLASITSGVLAQQGQETDGQESGGALEAVTRLQVFLDRAEFAPGKIDGRMGQFTLEALALYREAHGGVTAPVSEVEEGEGDGLPEVGDLDLAGIDPLFLSYEVSEDDLQQVGELPAEISAQAELKALPYRSAVEAIAERFHMDERYLEELNPGKTENIEVGDVLQVVNVEPFELADVEEVTAGDTEEGEDPGVAEDEKEGESNEEASGDLKKEEESQVLVNINTDTNMLTVFDGDKLIAAYPVTIGSGQTESPEGDWKVTGISAMPNFRHDRSMLEEGVRSDDFHMLPPGPNNPVGVMWIQLNKEGIGIHGTNDPGSIGRSSSAGCVRLANWDVVRFAEKIGVDVPVTIQAGPR